MLITSRLQLCFICRFLELLVYNVEKCWARGMEFKVGSEDEVHTRQKFHARTRLLKALKYARSLESITDASSRVKHILPVCSLKLPL